MARRLPYTNPSNFPALFCTLANAGRAGRRVAMRRINATTFEFPENPFAPGSIQFHEFNKQRLGHHARIERTTTTDSRRKAKKTR